MAQIENLIDVIQKYSLTVRCLPHVVVIYWSYREGDEERCTKPSYDSKGNIRNVKKSIVIQKIDLDYINNTPPSKYSKNLTPQERLDRLLKSYPTGERKLIREEKVVENGGWWYVKETPNTDSTIRFNREYDKFFAPTLDEAIKLFLDSKK